MANCHLCWPSIPKRDKKNNENKKIMSLFSRVAGSENQSLGSQSQTSVRLDDQRNAESNHPIRERKRKHVCMHRVEARAPRTNIEKPFLLGKWESASAKQYNSLLYHGGP